MSRKEYTYGDVENAVAIMDCLGDWPNDENLQDYFVGRSGVYRLVIELGKALDKAAKKAKLQWGEDLDWYLTTENIANKLRQIGDKWYLPYNYEQFVTEAFARID